MNKLKHTILEKIATGEIDQKSKWYFLTRDYVFYGVTILAGLLGALAASAMIHNIVRHHVEHMRGVLWSRDYAWTLLETLPLLWLLVFVLLVVVAWLNYKHTTRAYRHHNLTIVLAVLLLSLLGGLVLAHYRWGEFIEDKTRKHLPWYESRAQHRIDRRDNFLRNMPKQHREKRLERLNNTSRSRGIQYLHLNPHPLCRSGQYNCPDHQTKYRDRAGCGCQNN